MRTILTLLFALIIASCNDESPKPELDFVCYCQVQISRNDADDDPHDNKVKNTTYSTQARRRYREPATCSPELFDDWGKYAGSPDEHTVLEFGECFSVPGSQDTGRNCDNINSGEC